MDLTKNQKYDYVADGIEYPYEDRDIVTVIFLGSSISKFHIKEIEKENIQIRKEAKEYDIEPELVSPTYKEGGIQFKFGVIKVNEEELPFTSNYNVISIEQMPLHKLVEKGFNKYSTFTKGVLLGKDNKLKMKNKQPIIGDILPQGEARDYDLGISGLDEYAPEALKARQTILDKKWKRILKDNENLTEEEYLATYYMLLCRRFLLYKYNDNREAYIDKLEKGDMFNFQVKISKYATLVPHAWDFSSKSRIFYNKGFIGNSELLANKFEVVQKEKMKKPKEEEENDIF